MFNLKPTQKAPDGLVEALNAIAAQMNGMNVGINEITRRLVRVETRVCHLMGAANLDGEGRYRGEV